MPAPATGAGAFFWHPAAARDKTINKPALWILVLISTQFSPASFLVTVERFLLSGGFGPVTIPGWFQGVAVGFLLGLKGRRSTRHGTMARQCLKTLEKLFAI